MKDIDFIKSNAAGITVVHIRTLKSENRSVFKNSRMDYHLHILHYYDPETSHAGSINLDSDDITTAPCNEPEALHDVFQNTTVNLTELFINRVDSMLKAQKIKHEILFTRSEQALWDIFNEIKTISFSAGLEEIIQENESCSIVAAEDNKSNQIADFPDKVHRWAEIFISEERMYGAALR